jgi:hypothetical protein
MADGLVVAAALLVLLVILPAVLGLAFTGARGDRSRGEVLINADHANARATLAYYNEVHDSHSG